MFNEIVSGFTKVATPQRILVLIIFVVLAWLLLSYSDSKGLMMDAMETGTPSDASASASAATPSVASAPDMSSVTQGRTITDPKDLLPADANSQWAALNPVSMNQNDILAADMLQAGYHIGLDTIGQSMKNPNLQLRSDPPIPKQNVGPWNQSTYEPDISHRPLEIGSGAASA
jgi:hypothetical protein